MCEVSKVPKYPRKILGLTKWFIFSDEVVLCIFENNTFGASRPGFLKRNIRLRTQRYLMWFNLPNKEMSETKVS